MIVIHNENYPAKEFVGDHFELIEDGQYASGQVASISVGEDVVLVPLEPGDEVELVESESNLSLKEPISAFVENPAISENQGDS
jgi:hypothetical protein